MKKNIKKAYEQRRVYTIEDLPNKIDFVLRGKTIEDLKYAQVFDEIFKLNNIENLEFELSQKIELIKEFPSFIKYIEMKKSVDQVELLNKKKIELQLEINNIDEKINSLKSRIEIIRGGSKLKEKIEEIKEQPKEQKEIKTLIVGEDIKIYHKYSNSIHIYIKNPKSLDYTLEVGDLVDIADESGINRYIIKSSMAGSSQHTLTFKENIMTKMEG